MTSALGTEGSNESCSIRRIPYPYRAIVAICSDLDETKDADAYFEIARYLNTRENTRMGDGLGLEVGNTIYFDMPKGQFSYWNADDRGRALTLALLASGHIDCLHSYGDLATTRRHAGRALEELAKHSVRLTVWVDHAVAPTNLGADIMHGEGDLPGASAYHFDLTSAAGVRFVWRGRVTSVAPQCVRRSLTGIATSRHPLASTRTLLKEWMKGHLGRLGNAKYSPHSANQLMWPVVLRSGHSTTEFIRSNPSWAGVSCLDTGRSIGSVLTESLLNRLVHRGGVTILYTHLGKGRNGDGLLPPSACEGLQRLAQFSNQSKILVTTTARLLDYWANMNRARATRHCENDGSVIRVDVPPLEGDLNNGLQGLTVYVNPAESTKLVLNGVAQTELRCNPPDETGRTSVSIPWRRLRFPRM